MVDRRTSSRGPIRAAFVLVGMILAPAVAPAQTAPHPSLSPTPPPDAPWTADAVVDQATTATDEGLGAAQGVTVRDGKLYAYGDVRRPGPRVGVIREYGLDLRPTGRAVWLRKGGVPLILHPTGLTWHPRWGTFLGDTVDKKAKIYRLDWEKAWADGHLDNALIDTIDDDAAVNGCRPEFVTINGRPLIATADYGEIRPEIRLCDPDALLAAKRTSAPGVVVHRVLAGPWNQNLAWDGETGRLTCIENVIEGRGWRLDTIDLARAVAHGRVDGPGVRVSTATFDPHNELEGYCRLGPDRALFLTSSRVDNFTVGVIRPAAPHVSPPPVR